MAEDTFWSSPEKVSLIRFPKAQSVVLGVKSLKTAESEGDSYFDSGIYHFVLNGCVIAFLVVLLAFLRFPVFPYCHGGEENIFKSLKIKLKSGTFFFLLNILRTISREVPWHPAKTPPHKLENLLEADLHMFDNEISTSCMIIFPFVFFSNKQLSFLGAVY